MAICELKILSILEHKDKNFILSVTLLNKNTSLPLCTEADKGQFEKSYLKRDTLIQKERKINIWRKK